MENHPWQKRAKDAGLTQRALAKLLGRPEMTISRQLRGHWQSGIPKHVIAAIVAWDLMSEDQRKEWQRQMDDVPSSKE
ncbi:helix-turn-helix domain-containing protein [Mesorhizobium sp. 131-2-1]|uniref:helix-turn-helix domain-containing protein n=1 Tax=Mesorhizobium sp. 131-2-1 TaxID=2744518 RepID=UPI001927BBAC|nr:helix-turn-helix domain-containing protein [Mesorhizobium sp. 131-2-1]BCG91420.1 hypothetical protein MesoLj131a_02840 [Mesorhizobium sp. 131-2-1]